MSVERIKTVADQILARAGAVKGRAEEATTQALVMPLIQALGYDIWDPTEVAPGFQAEADAPASGRPFPSGKVDIAILCNGTPRIYVEVKPVDVALDGCEEALAHHFNAATAVTLGVLTNGVEWRFFTDTDIPHFMDAQPFHSSRLDALDQGLDQLHLFNREQYSPDAIRAYATELLATTKISHFLRSELDLRDKDPSDALIRWVLTSTGLCDDAAHADRVERFTPVVKNGLSRVLRDVVRRSVSAMDEQAAPTAARSTSIRPTALPAIPPVANPVTPETALPDPASEPSRGAVARMAPSSLDGMHNRNAATSNTALLERTTASDSELRLFDLVREQLASSALADANIFQPETAKYVPLEIGHHTTTSYFSIYLNKPTWWVIRCMLDAPTKWIGFNLDPQIATPLLPAGMTLLEPNAHAEVRVQIASAEDSLELFRLVFAALQKTIADREDLGEGQAVGAGAYAYAESRATA
jgi:hypothetical protein